MKLYTEEQVRKAMSALNDIKYMYYSEDDIINSLTPIELPSDEEIERESNERWVPLAFKVAVRWVIEHIKEQDK